MASYKLRFHPLFVDELEAAISYYNGHSRVAGIRFRSGVKKQLQLIRKNPQLKSVRYDDIRFAQIDKFPYSIHYSISKVDNCLFVQTLLCDYQDPGIHWRKRL